METTPKKFIQTAIETAEHFGFFPVSTFKKHPECKNCENIITSSTVATDRRLDALHGLLTSGGKIYTENKLNGITGPISFYTLEQVPRSGDVSISLHTFRIEKSIAEAILIQTTRAIAEELGYTNTTVRINSLGDRDSSIRYNRELTNYLKKKLDIMPAAARELMKQDGFSALMHLIEKRHELAQKSPSPLEYLSDGSRKHFREIVEFLDMSEIPYEIDPRLLGHNHCYSDTLFALDVLDDEDKPDISSPLMIRGGRYSEFMSRFAKINAPATGAVVILRDTKAPINTPRITRKKRPEVYVIQLGFAPKIRTLLLINSLRNADITVHQNLSCDSLTEQLLKAEEKQVRYAVIIGQKEFMEGSAILRDMLERKQENVPMNMLVKRLKRVTLSNSPVGL